MRRERAPATGGDSAGTPGLLTTSSTPSSNASSSSVPSRSSTPRSPSLPASTSAEGSAAATWTPRPASATAAARPDRASPTTRARLGSQASSGDGSSGRVLLTTHLPPNGGHGSPGVTVRGEAQRNRVDFVAHGYEFVVALQRPQPSLPLTTASSPLSSTSICANPTAESARTSSSPAAESGSANEVRPPAASTRAISSAADSSA